MEDGRGALPFGISAQGNALTLQWRIADVNVPGSHDRMISNVAVAIIGAGPYGLSIAAHLRRSGIEYRIFGIPMHTWRAAMPKGMFLKSEISASSLFDPSRDRTLERYYAEHDLDDAAKEEPVPLDRFIDYGLSFQRSLVPDLEETIVVALRAQREAFEIDLSTGERVIARRVILALGTTYFKQVPHPLSTLPRELASHSADHADLAPLGQRDVVVVGAGQSALETAAMLWEQGANVSLVARSPRIAWNGPPRRHSTMLQRLRRPDSGLGPGWHQWFYSHQQGLFQYLPEDLRLRIVRTALGPAGGWWLRDRFVGRVPVLKGHEVRDVRVKGDRVSLSLAHPDGIRHISADHVVAATGYKVDVGAIPFLDARLLRRLALLGTTPVVSRTFESSVAGLYFVGLASATRFGPSMRFVLGAGYTARKIAGALSAHCGDRAAPQTATSLGKGDALYAE